MGNVLCQGFPIFNHLDPLRHHAYSEIFIRPIHQYELETSTLHEDMLATVMVAEKSAPGVLLFTRNHYPVIGDETMLDQIIETWELMLYYLERERSHRASQFTQMINAELHLPFAYQLSEIHVIDLIAHMKSPNVTTIAANLHMTRGAVSKIMARLMERGDVVSFRHPDNQKNVYFRLTERGEIVRNVHHQFHERARTHVKEFFSRYSPEELRIVQMFMSDITAHVDVMLVPVSHAGQCEV